MEKIYTIICNGISYDLPKKTMAIWEELDAIYRMDSNPSLSQRQKFEKMLSFITRILGSEFVSEVFGSTSLEEIDLNDIVLTINHIRDSYENPLKVYQAEKAREIFKDLPLDKLTSVTKMIESSNSFKK